MTQQILTKYERARILGARALQIAMNAPLLIKIKKEDLEKINFDALKIAEIELDSDVLPISIHKPMPKKREGQLKKPKTPKMDDTKKEESEEKLEKEIIEEGEIMELAQPEDEGDEGFDSGGDSGED
ncbi:DNA-directed RNA polymerase subunit K [Candidatus Pacearchaeota archaeon]|nr:DNA-directed RNA polymerase subunit K [Candidatus Pacearchaeota archaeon]